MPVRIITGHVGVVQVKEKAVRIIPGLAGYIENYLKNGKPEQVVAIIKSCTPNTIGDLTVTLKDLSSTLHGIIHQKSLMRGVMERTLLITMRNVIKVFHKDSVPSNGSDVCWNVTHQEMADEEALNLALDEEARQARADQEWLEKC
nr:hypothetical protein [Tanacetum cinerariifolium]